MKNLCRTIKLTALLLPCFMPRASVADGPLWGLTYGNSFSIETTVERTTTVKIGDGAESTQRSTETTVVRYRMAAVRQSEITLQATVVNCTRTGEPAALSVNQLAAQRIGLCKGLIVYLSLDSQGVVTAVRQGDRSGSRVLSNGQGKDNDLIKASWNDRVIGSWLGRPFWCSLPPDKWKLDAEWEHTDEVSLGLFGQLRNIVTCTITNTSPEKTEVSMAGNIRHIPVSGLLTPDSQLLQLEDLTVLVDEFGGAATMIQPQPPMSESDTNGRPALPVSLRPWFTAMQLSWQINGEASVSIGKRQRKLVFKQQRKERSRLLPGYQIGRPRIAIPSRQAP